MNPYAILGSGVGTPEAASLRVRLSAWHDAMVAHERRLRTGRTTDRCDEECPHTEARTLWAEAVAAFGTQANDLAFLRSRALVASESQGLASRTAPRSADTGVVERAIRTVPPATAKPRTRIEPPQQSNTTLPELRP
jgi:hypothetical protein